MNEQHAEIHDVEVREQHAPPPRIPLNHLTSHRARDGIRVVVHDIPRHAGGQTVRESHEPVAEIVRVTAHSPPAAGQQLRACAGLHVLEVADSRIVGVGAEAAFLVVRGAENVEADRLDGEDEGYAAESEVDGVG